MPIFTDTAPVSKYGCLFRSNVYSRSASLIYLCLQKLTAENMAKETTLDFKTVCECNKCLGQKTLHPQATIINLENPCLEQDAVKFEFYAILLIEECEDSCCCCGRKYYDYTNATMVFLTPGEIFQMSRNNTLPDKGWLLAFHPDLLQCTSLKIHIKSYTFFNYRKEEALHLSQRETATITCCLENIEEELRHPIDSHTSTILSRHIELMLDYCTRFYERQFITRENRNGMLMKKFDDIVSEIIFSGKLAGGKLPSPAFLARMMNLSTAYFTDLLKFEKGMNPEEYIRCRQLEAAKQMLTGKKGSPAEISRHVGFPNVQYFSFLFKKITGFAPSDYLASLN